MEGGLVWLAEPGCGDPAVVGGKAANLSRLFRLHPVPPGFCLTARAHERWVDRVVEGRLPADLAELVARAYAALSEQCGIDDPPVAVRSSAIDEDGAEASFAGIYVTYLNVRGAAEVCSAVARCWAAANEPRVAAYRAQRGLSSARVGVLVQQLLEAETSAVVFSRNPMTGAADEVVINANYGLGESIVGGLATPDTWILQRPELSKRQFRLGAKEQMTVLMAGGTREVVVLRTLRARPCLDEAKARELARLALRLEEVMGWPVDLECAYHADKLYLLQCRPITTGKSV